MKIIILSIILASCCGCTIISYDRVFPKPAWYWSDEAKQQRADEAAQKKLENDSKHQ